MDELFKCIGQFGIPEDFAFYGEFTSGHIRLFKVVVFVNHIFLGKVEIVCIVRDFLTHRNTLTGIVNRRGQQIGHRQFPEFIVKLEPSIHASGNGNR